MSTLTIKDIAHTETLDQKALTAVTGGKMSGAPGAPFYCWPGDYDFSSHDSSIKAEQSIGQNQEVFNMNGNNAAFVGDISSKVKPVQTASNNIVRL